MRIEWQVAFWLLMLVLASLGLYMFASVLAPFVAALILGYVLDPVADRLQKLGLNRLSATLVIVAGFVVVLTIVLLVLAPVLGRQVVGFAESLPVYAARLQTLSTEQAADLLQKYGGDWLQKFGVDGASATETIQKSLGNFVGQGVQWAGNFLKSIWSGGQALVGIVTLTVITPVVTFYLLLDWDEMIAVLRSLVPPRHRATVIEIAGDIDRALSGFLRGQSLVCLFLGLWYGVGLSMIGLNFGFLIGTSAGLLSFIPYVGSLTALVFSAVVAIVQGWPGVGLFGEAMAVVVVGQFLEGNFLTPKLVGESVGLHPVWLIFALLAFGSLFGFAGMILAVPAAAAAGVLVRFAARRYKQSALFHGMDLDPT
ncbi:Predicted PurR-regulated permease PerM [Rhodoblastus acidophilus]|uniref:Predicted PurR-regulated permease PerM n=1 Tax=Rhodoblastus acidophilus TaxID=1074 RepID=A0A212RUK5_RHOAC|nr:AI-2E family transporter [Rhodoblastus acidophilus]MCW2315344.1 putative PurR-regulated permease PerM [Rhodoblastus acidophilus]PPQ37331.1 AI-2E family transporter [Rhodoblastus acidophilus]RAI23117.1 AI-2E family transporter [Rhodoblastus acidophilus]SNB76310.1 Predicted PurR-regulated permease PerM [Rhodoblastus acidophilus]